MAFSRGSIALVNTPVNQAALRFAQAIEGLYNRFSPQSPALGVGMSRTIGIVAVLGAALLAWMGRYELASTGAAAVFRLDRWTGEVAICTPQGCRPLPQSARAAENPFAQP